MDRDGTVVAGNGDASSSDSDSDMEEGGMEATAADSMQAQPQGPIIDEEGFELVQKRRPRGKAKG